MIVKFETIEAAMRELGCTRDEIMRSLKIAAIIPEAKEAARIAGLDNDEEALLEIASASPDQQVLSLEEIITRRKYDDEAAQIIIDRIYGAERDELIGHLDAGGHSALTKSIRRLLLSAV